jgi:hypothetical protein
MRRLIRYRTVSTAAGGEAGPPFRYGKAQKPNTKPQKVPVSSDTARLPMAKDEASAATNFEAPAPVCVCGLLIVAALTKGGHPHWGIGGMISAYILYLAMQYAKHGADSARALGVTDTIIMNIRTSTVGLTTAATIAAATVLMSGAVVAGSRLEEGLRCPIRISAGENEKAREIRNL